jgi:ubiquinone/menaquinone biosynthesis C-methylase UbiE
MTTVAIAKPRKDSPIEGWTAKWYAANTADMMNEYVELAERISAEVPPGSSVLEIAPGPGYFSIELARRGPYIVTGIDISRSFVKMASARAAALGIKVDFRQGSASNLPIQDNSYDFVLCRAAFKNFGEPVGALQEMYRVLKPGGRALIIDLSGGASVEAMDREVNRMKLSYLNRLLTRIVFKTVLIKRAYSKAEFEGMLKQTRFNEVSVKEDGIILEVTMVK